MAEYPPELVDTIAAAIWKADSDIPPIAERYDSLPEPVQEVYAEMARAALDAITAGPRAIVDLPAAVADGWWRVVLGGDPEQVYRRDGDEPIVVSGLGSFTDDEAVQLAAALLAAAAVAERGETDQ